MKKLLIALAFVAACKGEAPVTQTSDTRVPIEIGYVGSPELQLREKADDASPVIATFQNGETVSVLAKQGEWVEIRTGDRSGWAHAAELTSASEAQAAADDPQPKFRRQVMPVTAPGAKGEIYLEADVNSDGDVIGVRTLLNSTGSDALLDRNVAALKEAQFYPIVQKGERKGFKYYHRVTY
jgi:uncharacterized protein YgiM (DUF1202 family)